MLKLNDEAIRSGLVIINYAKYDSSNRCVFRRHLKVSTDTIVNKFVKHLKPSRYGEGVHLKTERHEKQYEKTVININNIKLELY